MKESRRKKQTPPERCASYSSSDLESSPGDARDPLYVIFVTLPETRPIHTRQAPLQQRMERNGLPIAGQARTSAYRTAPRSPRRLSDRGAAGWIAKDSPKTAAAHDGGFAVLSAGIRPNIARSSNRSSLATSLRESTQHPTLVGRRTSDGRAMFSLSAAAVFDKPGDLYAGTPAGRGSDRLDQMSIRTQLSTQSARPSAHTSSQFSGSPRHAY